MIVDVVVYIDNIVSGFWDIFIRVDQWWMFVEDVMCINNEVLNVYVVRDRQVVVDFCISFFYIMEISCEVDEIGCLVSEVLCMDWIDVVVRLFVNIVAGLCCIQVMLIQMGCLVILLQWVVVFIVEGFSWSCILVSEDVVMVGSDVGCNIVE